MIKFLTSDQENWLFEHYPNHPNNVLAEKLTEMVRKENEKRISQLEKLLPSVTDAHVSREIRRRVNKLRSFKSISPGYVRTIARRIGCPHKSTAIRTRIARSSAFEMHYKRWKEIAVVTDLPPMQFFRSIQLNEVRVIKYASQKDIRHMRVYLSSWNRTEGFEKGIYITASQIPDTCILRYEATYNRATGKDE